MPVAIVVAGSPGAGKTTLASHMIGALPGGGVLVDKDTLEWPLANVALAQAGIPPDSHETALYQTVIKAASYETMERVAEQNIAAGSSVVLVAPFSSHVLNPDWLSRLSVRLCGVPVHLLWVSASASKLHARKRARSSARDAVELQTANEATFAAAEAKRRPPVGPHVAVDTTDVSAAEMPSLARRLLAQLAISSAAPASAASSSAACSAPASQPSSGDAVLCAGHACIDVLMSGSAELPSREGYAPVERFEMQPGGAVSNVGGQCAALGAGLFAVHAAAVVGSDQFGQLLLDAWRAAGVGCDLVTRDSKWPTSVACLPVYSDGKRASYCAQGWNSHVTPQQLLGEKLEPRRFKFLTLGYPHVMPRLSGDDLAPALARVCRAGCAVAIDMNEAFDDPAAPLGEAEDAFSSVAILKANLEEAAACVGRKRALMRRASGADNVYMSVDLESVIEMDEMDSLATALLARGAAIVCITMGAQGVYGATADATKLRVALGRACPKDVSALASQRLRCDAFLPCGHVNSVGAGDAFLAGVVAALCFYSSPSSSPTPSSKEPAAAQPLSLKHVLRIGLASALYRVDTARPVCPPLSELIQTLDGLETLSPTNRALLAAS
jgi:sugar/nucleoside kinase (ribokinase family)/predicted kinase